MFTTPCSVPCPLSILIRKSHLPSVLVFTLLWVCGGTKCFDFDTSSSQTTPSSYSYELCMCYLAIAPITVDFSLQVPEPTREHTIKSHSEGIALLVWSPDDTMLLSCGKEDNQEALVYSTHVRKLC